MINSIDPSITEVLVDGNVFKVGDIVYTYHKGFHKILGFYTIIYLGSRSDNVVVCKRIATNTFKKSSKIDQCNIHYLRKVDANTLIAEKEQDLKNAIEFLSSIGLLTNHNDVLGKIN